MYCTPHALHVRKSAAIDRNPSYSQTGAAGCYCVCWCCAGHLHRPSLQPHTSHDCLMSNALHAIKPAVISRTTVSSSSWVQQRLLLLHGTPTPPPLDPTPWLVTCSCVSRSEPGCIHPLNHHRPLAAAVAVPRVDTVEGQQSSRGMFMLAVLYDPTALAGFGCGSEHRAKAGVGWNSFSRFAIEMIKTW